MRGPGKSTVGAVLLTLLVGVAGPLSARQREYSSDALPSLPLVELRVRGAATLALAMSGDGNWATFIRGVADSLVAHRVSVVGLKSRSYLRRARTPEEVASDMEAVLRHYVGMWSATSVLIVGYSRGADFAPFIVNRLGPDVRNLVRGVVLLSPARTASFEFHWTDLFGYTPRPSDIPLLPEVEALAPLTVVCVYGRKDRDSLCPLLRPGTAQVHVLTSGHRLEDAGQVFKLMTPLVEGAADGTRSPDDRESDAGGRPAS